MIKQLAQQRTIRRTTAVLEYNDPETGEIGTEEITVRYFSPTIAESKAERDEMKRIAEADSDEVWWLSDSLIRRLHSLTDSKGETVEGDEITKEFLDGFDSKNLTAIRDAIDNDLRPKSEGTKSPTGTAPKGR